MSKLPYVKSLIETRTWAFAVPKSVTLNDLDRRNGRYFAIFYRIRQFWWLITSKLPKIDPYFLWSLSQMSTDF